MMAANQGWISETEKSTQDLDSRAEAKFRKLSLAQMNWRPDKDTWSVVQQLDHMVLANKMYVPIIERLTEASVPYQNPYKPGFWGGFLIKAVGPDAKINSPVPKPLIPTEQPLDLDILDEFMALQRRYYSSLSKLGDRDMNAKFTSPFAKFVKLKLGDAIKIIALHNERHLLKALALIERADFPR